MLWLCAACATEPSEQVEQGLPRLPPGNAGKILARGLEAAGGWQRWKELHDVSFISSLTITDQTQMVASERTGWYTAPLHAGARARMDSIGLSSVVQFGMDGTDAWIIRDGQLVTDSSQIAVTRFDLASTLFWFSLPFVVAELPATVTDLGTRDGDGGVRWDLLKVVFDPNDVVPGEWFVLYFDHETGLLDQVHGRLAAPFLQHKIWLGKWLEYRDCDGLMEARHWQFFPANAEGELAAYLVANQFIEHVRFNTGFPAKRFDKPPIAQGAEPVRWREPGIRDQGVSVSGRDSGSRPRRCFPGDEVRSRASLGAVIALRLSRLPTVVAPHCRTSARALHWPAGTAVPN